MGLLASISVLGGRAEGAGGELGSMILGAKRWGLEGPVGDWWPELLHKSAENKSLLNKSSENKSFDCNI